MDNQRTHCGSQSLPRSPVLQPRQTPLESQQFDHASHQIFLFINLVIILVTIVEVVLVFVNINFGHSAYIISGGESNPGPPRPRRNLAPAGAQIAAAVNNFRLTQVYLRGRDKVYPDQVSLDRFNNWVRANIAQIDPAETAVCGECGDADLILCGHHVKPIVAAAAVPPPPAAPAYRWSFRNFFRPLMQTFTSPVFNFGLQNNRLIGYLGNEQIQDREIIPELYNYITVNQQTSYVVNGADARNLRLAHSHRLAHRWAEVTKRSDELSADTVFANRFKFTIQRASDQQENTMLYGYSNPSDNFGLAWLPTSWVIYWLIATLLTVSFFLLGKVFMPLLVPKLAELAVWHYMGSVRLIILTAWAGSVQLFRSATAMLLELLEPLLGVLLTQFFSLFAWGATIFLDALVFMASLF